MPLDLLRRSVIVKFWYRVQTLPDSPTCATLLDSSLDPVFAAHTRHPRPLSFRGRSLIGEFFLPRLSVATSELLSVPPRQFPSVSFRRSLPFPKASLPVPVTKSLFLDHASKHEDYIPVFKTVAWTKLNYIHPIAIKIAIHVN